MLEGLAVVAEEMLDVVRPGKRITGLREVLVRQLGVAERDDVLPRIVAGDELAGYATGQDADLYEYWKAEERYWQAE